MIIGSDIGGVIKNLLTDNPIDNSIECINKLAKTNTLILISKCKETYKEHTIKWLEKVNLNHIKTFFCEEYEDKIKIANDNNISIMIDDKMQVLNKFPDTILKIWFCNDNNKILGAKRFQPDFFNSVKIAKNWNDIMAIITS